MRQMRRKNKRAMEAGRVFTYALALVVIAMIMIYGYSQVIAFKDRATQVIFLKFQEQIKNDIRAIATDYDTVRVYTYKLPAEYDEVCFADEACKTGVMVCIPNAAARPIISNALSNGIPESVFISLRNRTQETVDVGPISVITDQGNHFGCEPIRNGEIKVRMKGLGDKAQIQIVEGTTGDPNTFNI